MNKWIVYIKRQDDNPANPGWDIERHDFDTEQQAREFEFISKLSIDPEDEIEVRSPQQQQQYETEYHQAIKNSLLKKLIGEPK